MVKPAQLQQSGFYCGQTCWNGSALFPTIPRTSCSGLEPLLTLSRTTCASFNTPPADTKLQRRHHIAHYDAANAPTENMTQDAQLKVIRKTGGSKNKKQHTIGCDYTRIEVDDRQLMIQCTAGVGRELGDQFLAARNGTPPCSAKAFVRTVCEIEHHDVSSTGIFTDKLCHKNPRKCPKQALTTLVDATEAYLVEVMTESNM